MRKGGEGWRFFFLFFFGVCVYVWGALGKDWKRRDEVKQRGGRGRRGSKK